MMTRLKRKIPLLGLGLLVVTACTPAVQPPVSQMALANEAVEEATSVGAYEYAPVELRAAQDKINQAEVAMQAKDNLTAGRLLKEAEVDAKLAEAKSTTAKSQKAVNELQKSIDLLSDEINRKQAQ
ncbi:MAG: DUF4398 domain-containing protein [Syntrophotaleaceae bacterium]